MTKQISERKALFLLLIVSFIWGTGFFVTDIALRGFTSLQVVSLRFLVGAGVLTVIFRKHLSNITKYEVQAGAVTGLLLSLAFATQVYGQYFSTPSISAFITVVYVVLVPIFSKFFFNRKISKSVFISAILVLVGIFVISFGSSKVESNALNMPLGILITTVSAFGWAFQVMLIEYFTQSGTEHVNSAHLTITMLWSAFAFSIVFNIISFVVFGEKFTYSEYFVESLAALVFLGVFSTAVGFYLQSYAQRYATASKAAIIMSLESVFGALMSGLILHEQFNLIMILGFAIVFVAVLLAELSPGSKV